MRVCKHGCDIKMFCFSRANHASANLKKVFELKTSTSLLYSPISSSDETWKIFRNMLRQFFFTWADILSKKKTVFWKASFLQNKDCFVYKTSRKNLSINQCSKQESFTFFSGKLFYKSKRKLFSYVCISWYKHSRGWENSQQLCKPSTSSRVCITVSISPNPSCVYIRLCKHGKRFLLLNCIPRTLVLEQKLSGNS